MTIRSAAQLRALVAPARQEVVDALESAGPCGVAALARLLGRPVTALYFHVRALERVGLVRACGARRAGGRVAGLYDVARRPNMLDYDGPAGRGPIAKIIGAAVRQSQREFARACLGGEHARGTGRLVWGARTRGWLTTGEVRALNALLSRAAGILRAGRPREGARAISLAFLLAPVGAKAGRGGRARSRPLPTKDDRGKPRRIKPSPSTSTRSKRRSSIRKEKS